MRNRMLLLLSFALTSSIGFAQDYTGSNSLLFNQVSVKGNAKKNAQGTPYYNDAFLLANVSSVNEKLLMRYNAEADEFEIDKGDGKIFIMPQEETFNTVTFSHGEKFRLLDFQDGAAIVKGYLVEVNANDKVSIYRQEKTTIREQTTEVGGYGSAKPARFAKLKPQYYIQIGKAPAVKLEDKKQIFAFFPNHKDQITAFLKKEKTSFKEDEDLKKFGEFLATL